MNEKKGLIYVVYITTRGIPALTFALACIADQATATEVKIVSSHTSSNIDWAKQDIRNADKTARYQELFPQGYELIDLDEISTDYVHAEKWTEMAIDAARLAIHVKSKKEEN